MWTSREVSHPKQELLLISFLLVFVLLLLFFLLFFFFVMTLHLYTVSERWHFFTTPILKSLVVPVIWLALIDAIYSWIAPFFSLNCIFFPANEEATLTTKKPIGFQGLFKVANQIAGKWKTKSIMWQILQLLFPKLLLFPPKKWMNLISDRLSTASIKYLTWPSPLFGWFENGCNKVVTEPRVVQFGLKPHLWFQPKLHSTQFNYHYE